MRVVVGISGALLVAGILLEFFLVYLLPRRVKRDPRLARQLYDIAWRPWRALSRQLPPRAADTLLGMFGPLGLIGILLTWVVALILGFAALYWAIHSRVAGHTDSFAHDLFYSGGVLFSTAPSGVPAGTFGHLLRIVEAASGFGVIFIVIGYLPSLYQAYGRREVAVSQLDPRAGSPPSAGTLLLRGAERGDWEAIDAYLHNWESWTADLMETHLAYPVLAYFRSQHVNQNWLSALTTIMDSCTFAMAATSAEVGLSAEMTYRIGRHALVDLAYNFHVTPLDPEPDRLPREALEQLVADVEAQGLEIADLDPVHERLTSLRRSYEPYANALAARLELTLPDWLAPAERSENWSRRPWKHTQRSSVS